MPKKFHKIKECGCIIQAITCGCINNDKMYLLGGHKYYIICDKCKQDEESGNDTLYDMWINDNLTNDLGYAGWNEDK